MDTVKGFIGKHIKKIIIGLVLCVITFGIYGFYKLFTAMGES